MFLVLMLCVAVVLAASPTSAFDSVKDDSKITTLPNDEPSTIPRSNTSASLPPTDFSIRVNAGTIPIGPTACFEAVTTALYQLAELDFSARSISRQVVRPMPLQIRRLALYLTGPYRRGGFDNKYIIWGLTLAIEQMVGGAEFLNHQFVLFWRGTRVGMLAFVHEDSSTDIEANDTSAPVTSFKRNAATATTGSMENDFQIVYDIHESPAPDLVFNHVMMVIVGGFTDIAPRDMVQEVDNHLFLTSFSPYTASFMLAPSSGSASTAWLTYDAVRHALMQLALWYLSRPTCRASQMTVYVDGILGGCGNLGYRRPVGTTPLGQRVGSGL